MVALTMSRRGLLGGLGALAAIGLVGCRRDSEVTYQLSWTHSVQFGGTYLAKSRGIFKDLGLDVTLVAGGPNMDGDASTARGDALLNISAGDGVARSNAQGADLVIIGAQYQKYPGTILSLADAALREPKDMIGKTIGAAATDQSALLAFLEINGLRLDQVQVVHSRYDPAVLTAAQVDGLFCFYSDLPVALEMRGIAGYPMLLADFGYNPMSQTYTALRSSLDDAVKRDQISRLIRGDARGWQLYKNDPQVAATITVQDYPDAGLDLATQERQAEEQLDIMFSELTDRFGFAWFTDEQISQNIELYERLGIEGVTEQLWDRSILAELYADGPTA